MRRRFAKKAPDPNAPPPVIDPRTPPPKPKELLQAQGTLQELLLGKPASIATGFGFGDMSLADRTPAWRLYVFTDDPKLLLPNEVMGFPVTRRQPPVISPNWGKHR